MKLHESGTALAEGMGVPVSKMPGSIEVLCQASLKTAKDPDRGPYPAYPSGKSWCEACGKTGSGKKFYHNVMSGGDFAAQHRSTQSTQQHCSKQSTATRVMEGRENREKSEEEQEIRKEMEKKEVKGKGERPGGEEDSERRRDEGVEDKEVDEYATDWVEVRRRTRGRSCKMVQIFVKVNGSKATPMDVNLTDDTLEDMMRQVQKDEDAYVTMQGKVLGAREKLKSCGVTEGCTIQVTSRLRGGGKHKDQKGQKERRRAAKPKGPEQKSEEPKRDKGPAIQECDRDTVVQMIEESEENRKVMVRMLEENEDNRKMIESICEGNDVEVEQALQNYRTAGREVLGWDQGQAVLMERGLRWTVEARRKGKRQQEKEQRRQREQGQHPGQEQGKQGKQVGFGEAEHLRETRPKSTDEPEVMGRSAEVRTGRGSSGLLRGEMRGLRRTRPGKAKERVKEERVNMKAKEEELEGKEHSRSRTW